MTLVGGHSKNARAQEAIRTTLATVRDCLKLVAEARPAVAAMPTARSKLFLPAATALTESPARRHGRNVDAALANLLRPCLGEAVTKAITAVALLPRVDEQTSAREFARVLIAQLRAVEPTTISSLDDLSEIMQRLVRLDVPGAEPWIGSAVGQIGKQVQPALRRTRGMDAARAAAIRTPAVALAVHAVQRENFPTAADAYALAIGATILEQRTSRPETAPEVILLAQA